MWCISDYYKTVKLGDQQWDTKCGSEARNVLELFLSVNEEAIVDHYMFNKAVTPVMPVSGFTVNK